MTSAIEPSVGVALAAFAGLAFFAYRVTNPVMKAKRSIYAANGGLDPIPSNYILGVHNLAPGFDGHWSDIGSPSNLVSTMDRSEAAPFVS